MLTGIVGCTEDQVRKDFQAINMEKGKPNSGREVQAYIDCIEDFLGYHNSRDVIVVGIGHLGGALMNFDGFSRHGFNILAGFDRDPVKIGEKINGHQIFGMEKMENLINRLKVRVAIVTLPTEETQAVVDQLVHCGIKAIWNFAPVHLDVPDDVIVENADLAAALSILTLKLEERDKQSRQHVSA